MSGETGSLAELASIQTPRKVFTHINNSNPVLADGSPEHRTIRTAGWEVAFDGMEVVL
jgi:pyrroloquinoline quinone biosynthesis protein B